MQGKKRRVRALILAPTRELALQVSSHLNDCINHIETETKVEPVSKAKPKKSKAKGKGKESEITEKTTSVPKAPPHVSVAAIVGGMSAQKQRRILDRGVDVLVATPGRLWDIMEDVCRYFLFLAPLCIRLFSRMIAYRQKSKTLDSWYSTKQIE